MFINHKQTVKKLTNWKTPGYHAIHNILVQLKHLVSLGIKSFFSEVYYLIIMLFGLFGLASFPKNYSSWEGDVNV